METKKVWFVTGASKGLGLSLVKQLLDAGHKVAATSRNLSDLQKAVSAESESFLPLAVNIKSEESVEEAITRTVSKFERLDVVVNNAGYGLVGSLEELSDRESRENFDVNVFGLLNVIRKALPQLREQKQGHIINIASIAGFSGLFPGFGIYCATKFAVHGLTESLAAEVKPFGIHTTLVSPGYFRTDFLTSGSLGTPENPLEAYKEVRQTQQMHQEDINGNQPGDPEKAVEVIIKASESKNPPLHLFLGEDSYQLAQDKINLLNKDLEDWKELATKTGFEYAS
ncbi:SDR family oxidoreductase [Desertivirga brevis]|uniref:SDR family oxidoreductase n=1 Tax=Desertivirga brevis TaxID=2810310 RepID=UPI001A96C25E|nr:SDR family oxidoreductase [Pedobacter sp. SYSU D00873]